MPRLMPRRKKSRKLGGRPVRRRTAIPAQKRPLAAMLRRYLPFIVIAASILLIALFLYAQHRAQKPTKIKLRDLVEATATSPVA